MRGPDPAPQSRLQPSVQFVGIRHPPSEDQSVKTAPRYAWWRELIPGPRLKTGWGKSPSPPQPSKHLQWARQIRAQQHEWFSEKQKTRRRVDRSISRELPTRPLIHRWKAHPAWEETLRELDPHPPVGWLEQRRQRARTHWGLQRLKSAQEKWRQDHLGQHQSRTLLSESIVDDTSSDQASSTRDGQKDCHDTDIGSTSESYDAFWSLNPTRPTEATQPRRSSYLKRLSMSLAESMPVRPAECGSSELLATSEFSRRTSRLDSVADNMGPASDNDGASRNCNPLTSLEISPKSTSAEIASIPEHGSEGKDEQLPPVTHTASRRRKTVTIHTQRPGGEDLAWTSTYSDDSESELWEKWILRFPPAVLDLLARSWKSLGEDEFGERTVSITELKSILAVVLGRDSRDDLNIIKDWDKVVPDFVGDPRDEDTCTAAVPTLPEFLEVISAALSYIEKHEIRLLWTDKDCMQVEKAMTHYLHGAERMPMIHLFNVIRDVEFLAHIDTSSVENQQRLVRLVQKDLQGQTSRSEQRGTLSLQEVLTIMTFAIMEDDQMRRKEEFEREHEARVKVGFTRVEMEVLRELHQSYTDMKVPNMRLERHFKGAAIDEAVTRLTSLLGTLGVTEITEEQRFCLEDTVQKHLPETSSAVVPLPIFMFWMSGIFKERIGGLTQTSLSPSAFEAARPFISVMVDAMRPSKDDPHASDRRNSEKQSEAATQDKHKGPLPKAGHSQLPTFSSRRRTMCCVAARPEVQRAVASMTTEKRLPHKIMTKSDMGDSMVVHAKSERQQDPSSSPARARAISFRRTNSETNSKMSWRDPAPARLPAISAKLT